MLPLLALRAEASEQASLKDLGIALLVLTAAILIMKPLSRLLLRWVSSVGLREVFTAFALLVVVGMAALMQSLNLSMGLGAFAAGVMLANSEYRHALESDIEPFKGLLLGLFFMSVGMSIDFAAVFSEPMFLVALVLGILLIKIAVLLALGKLSKFSKPDNLFFSILLSQVGEFSFVIFAAATSIGLIESQMSSTFVAAAALSMLSTPLLLSLYEKLYLKKIAKEQKSHYDAILDEEPEVIIAGFGRFGQIVGRLLLANGIKSTVLDRDSAQIEFLRKFGFKVYYGDATRLDLLEAAGIKKAKVLVNAIDDVQSNLNLIDAVRKEFPHIKIVARARNVQHAYELMDRKVDLWERETFESSLLLGTELLCQFGWSRHEAYMAANRFRAHNLELIQRLYYERDDQKRLTSKAIQGRRQLEEQFESMMKEREKQDEAWHA